MALAARFLEDLKSGTGGVLLVEGEGGVGKSAYVHAVEVLAKGEGLRVLAARAGELEQGLPFGVVREIFTSMVSAGRGFAAALQGAAALAMPALAGAPTEVNGVDSFSVLHGLYWLTVEAASGSPLLITVDDAQWGDLPSLRFLNYLVRRLHDLPVFVMAAASHDVTSGRELLANLAAERITRRIHLQPLRRAAAQTLIAAHLGCDGEPRFVEECIQVTGGNPFLLHELMSELVASGVRPLSSQTDRLTALAPRSVRDAVQRRLGRLPAGATSLAHAAAILGDSADLACAAPLAGLSTSQAATLADSLVEVGILEPRLGLTFVHPMVRSVVCGMIGPGQRAEAHRKAAELLMSSGWPGEAVVPHLLIGAARGDPRMVDLLTEQAERACDRGAPDTAAQYLRRALAEPADPERRSDLLLRLGVAEMSAGASNAVLHLRASVRESAAPIPRARACLALAKASLMEGGVAEAVQACEQGIEEVAGEEPELALELEAELFAATRHEVTAQPTVSRTELVRDRATAAGRAESVLLANLAMAEAYRFGSRERVIELAEAALAGDWLFQQHAVLTLPTAVHSLAVAGRLGQARHIWDDAIERYRARGEVRGYTLAATFRGHTALLLGDVNAAVADGRSGVDLAREHGLEVVQTLAVAWLIRALTESGNLDAAEKELAKHFAHRRTSTPANNSFYSARGHLRLAQGRWESAVQDLRSCEAGLAAWGIANPWLSPYLTQLATALEHQGRHDAAVGISRRALEQAREWGVPGPLADALRVASVIDGGPESLDLLREAVAISATGESPLERARALTSLGECLRRNGRPRESREPLRVALDIASTCGAGLIVRRANSELVASGAQPRRTRATGVQALTAMERRVVVMVAGERTNRAVAQALFVSEKTIETHLAHAYRKLGISSRSQLAAVLGAHRYESE